MADEGIVFKDTLGRLAELDEMTVTVIPLVLDGPFASTLSGEMLTVSELSAWLVDGDPGVRTTVDLAYALESGSGVVRYLTDSPSLDLAGVAEINAVAFADPAGGSDATDVLLFAIPVEPGAGFDGWIPDEPVDGLARVSLAAPEASGGGATVGEWVEPSVPSPWANAGPTFGDPSLANLAARTVPTGAEARGVFFATGSDAAAALTLGGITLSAVVPAECRPAVLRGSLYASCGVIGASVYHLSVDCYVNPAGDLVLSLGTVLPDGVTDLATAFAAATVVAFGVGGSYSLT